MNTSAFSTTTVVTSTTGRRRLRRREIGQVRRASYWAARTEAAESPSAKASVAWDHFRARVAAMPEDKRAAAWEGAVIALARISPDRGQPKHRNPPTPTA